SADIPEIELLSDVQQLVVKDPILNLQLKLRSKQSPLNRLLVSVNDVPLEGRNGKFVGDQNPKEQLHELRIPLNRKNNQIKITVSNQAGMFAEPIRFQVFYEGPEQKPRLYVIGLGVAIYSDQRLNLRYPNKDVEDVLRIFSSNNQAYDTIITRSLLNEAFTTDRLKALRALLEQTEVDDRVVLFYAGHGIIDAQSNYYLATTTVDFDHPASGGVAYEVLENLLDGIPARRKLLFLDACFSGEIDQSAVKAMNKAATSMGSVRPRSIYRSQNDPGLGLNNTLELMKELFVDLRRNTGATVISSAGGFEFAWEGKQWNNGVFTHCLQEGLETFAADSNGDRQIMVSELQSYLAKAVLQKTKGQQRPAFRVENVINDWRIW
ncbi:MAG: caspase family protein, partial [Bacteroidota bacterium]